MAPSKAKSESTDDEEYSPEETERRAQAALKRALNMPPKPHEDMRVGKRTKTKRSRPNANKRRH